MNTESSYTCPMHPEVIQNKPGSCPKCGMALEFMISKTEEVVEKNYELDYMSRRFWISLFFSFPVFIVAMLNDLTPEYIPSGLSTLQIQWFLFLFSSPVVLWGGWPFFVRGYESVKTWNLNMFTLIAIGVGSAYIYSLVALFFPEFFPPLMQSEDGYVHVYFEAAAVITTLVLLGQVLELRARSKTNTAIKILLNLAPKKAHRVKDGVEEEVDIKHIKVGDILSIKPGEKIPVDGVVSDGESNVDESMITGEPIVIPKLKGDTLIGATINKNGTLKMRAEKIGSDTMLAQIVHMVSQAQLSRAPIQNLADKVSSYFVPAVVISAVLSFIVWYIFGPQPRLAYAIVSAVAVLIIACPCALGLATPISIMVATGRAALSGILIKDAKNIEIMEKVNVLVVDKTGTLTEGRPRVTSFFTEEGFDKTEVLKYAASLELSSEHPLSEAVVSYAKEQDLNMLDVKNFRAVTGEGIVGEIEAKKISIGSENFLQSLGISTVSVIEKADEVRKRGGGVVYIAIDSKLSGIMGLEDPIKETTKQALKDLKTNGIKVVMLSGDNETTANAVADKLGIDEVYADVMPDAKAEVITKLQKSGDVVAMAGDGINDAPSLAQADVGIAMGTGTDVAIESAGITLVKGDLLGIVKVLKLSRATMKNIRQNLFFAFVYNSAGVPIAAGVLYPFFGILLSPVIAATAMSFSSVSVIVNALRLKNIKT
ncbi:copper-translocating P-type ATPase [Sulfurimonas lithotrophica]|uniref:Copper-transporting ATPase n=1 Tax=Sulfurimonas lithotrophica TaxID=2590022 RepID=A0A5P8P1Q1_9BACT|nr:copper-translocating P-type ATPase [Sulfurimonas lithotrophica]